MAPRLAVAPKGPLSNRSHRRTGAPSGRPLNGDFKIISGGQTGADRAALDIALKLKIPCGGWCPADRRAEDGIIADRYPLTPLRGAGYRQRTRKNVQDSDGTVILTFGKLTGGSKATADDCARFAKPCLVIDARKINPRVAAMELAVFILRHHILVLNIAGPRASNQPGIYDFVSEVLTNLLRGPTRRRRKPPLVTAALRHSRG
jgi:hypothetical protein